MSSFFRIVDEHHLVGNEHFVVQLDLAVDIVDVVLGQGDGLVEHVLELGQHTRDLSKQSTNTVHYFHSILYSM